VSREDAEALAALTRYDDIMYQKYLEKKRPTDEMELFLEQRQARKRMRSATQGA
jgi:hypothetical protein